MVYSSNILWSLFCLLKETLNLVTSFFFLGTSIFDISYKFWIFLVFSFFVVVVSFSSPDFHDIYTVYISAASQDFPDTLLSDI